MKASVSAPIPQCGHRALGLLVGALATALASACSPAPERPGVSRAGAHADLATHSAKFGRQVIEVTEGVHVAIGYGLANSILIEGDDGVVIVDTMESAEAAADVKAAFDRITTAPVRALVYTHNHADHVLGAGVFAGDDDPQVISHASTLVYLDRVFNVIRPVIYKRSMRQFGTALADIDHVGCGIGPKLRHDRDSTIAHIRPTRTFDTERTEIDIAGVRMVLVHAPGETPDQIFVWLPDKKVLLAGDNFYESFPNLYAVRGTAYRDVTDWVRSLDKMRDFAPEYLVPSHTLPISGAENVGQALTDYRDAIQFVHDQTVRGMNAGLGPMELARTVRLPEHLARRSYLHEYYGRVDWSVRAIFTGYLGWFGGNATDLHPLYAEERAARTAELAGGVTALADAARRALETGEHQWALELADHWIALESDEPAAHALRASALRALAAEETSANGRNYYLTQAAETEGTVDIVPADPSSLPVDTVRAYPIGNFMHAMAVNLDPAKSGDAVKTVAFRFPDADETFTVAVRRGVAEVRPRAPAQPDVSVTVDSTVWKEILAGHRNAAAAYAAGDIEVDGGLIELTRFLLWFRAD